MPVMEAMSVGVPVFATACGALPELLADERGFLLDTEYSMVDPWGNSRRDFPNADDGANRLATLFVFTRMADPIGTPINVAKNAHSYMQSRTWDKPVQQIVDAVEKLTSEETK